MLKNLNFFNSFIFFLPLWCIFFVNNLFFFWLAMEIFNIIFLCYYGLKKNYKSFFLYIFMVQSISALFLLLFLLMKDFKFYNDSFSSLGVILSLMMKMGLVPFHGWVLKSTNMMNFEDLYLFLMIMKIMPYYMFFYFFFEVNIEYILLIFNMFYSFFLMFLYNSVKKILVLSSISTSSLILFLSGFSTKIFLSIFIFYYLFIFFLFFFFDNFNIKMLFDVGTVKELNFFFFIFSLVGIPVSIGFFLKWYIFSEMMYSIFFYIFLFFYISSVVSAFFYMKVIFFTFCLSKSMEFYFLQNKVELSIFAFLFLCLSIFVFIFFIGS